MSAVLLAIALGAAFVVGILGALMGLAWIVAGPVHHSRYRLAAALLFFWASAALGVYLAIVDARTA